MNLVFLAAIIVACQAAKLDRTYLPPPSSQYAGGTPGSLQAPFITGANRMRPGFFQSPFVRTSDNIPSQGNLPSGSYENENEGVVVDAAAPGTRASNQPSGLGGPRVNYGSTDSKVGDAAFRGTKNQAGPNINGGFQSHTQFGSFQSQGSFGPNNKNQDPDVSAFNQPTGQINEGYRPGNQLFKDRVSNTIKYHNKIGLKKFNYGFETENGIKMEQNGVSNDGIHTQGGYSYTGDDGKVYSVFYTADKDGYRPMGAHLPTPPPIPVEILEALQQNARDEANGLHDDGSYDAQKYNAEDDYTPSDTNGNHNDRQSNKFEKRPGFNVGAFINQQQHGFVRPNVQGQFAYDFSKETLTNTDTTKVGTGGIGYDKTDSKLNAQLNNGFGSQFQYLPLFGNAQGSKPLQEKDYTLVSVSNVRPLTEQKFQDNGSFGNIVAPISYGTSIGHFEQGSNNQQPSSQSINSFGTSNSPQNEGELLQTLTGINNTLSLPTPIINIGITSSEENQNNNPQNQKLPFQTNLQSLDKNKISQNLKPDLTNGFTSHSSTLIPISPSSAPDKEYEPEKNTFDVNSITQASILPFPSTSSTSSSHTHSGEVYEYPKPEHGLPTSQEDIQESSYVTTSQDDTIKPQINVQFNNHFGQQFPTISTSLFGQNQPHPQFAAQGSSFGQNPTSSPGDNLSYGHKTTPSRSDAQTSTSVNQQTTNKKPFEQQKSQTSFGQQTTPTQFGGHSNLGLGQESSQAQDGQTSFSFGSQTTPSRLETQGSTIFGQQSIPNALKKPCGVCSSFGSKITRPHSSTQNSFSNTQMTPSHFGGQPSSSAEQISTLSSFGTSLNQETTSTRFGVQAISFGQTPTQPQLGTQTSSSFGSQKTPSRFGVQTGSSFDQETTPSTFGTNSFTGQQITPTFGVQTSSAFGQQPSQTFGVPTGSTLGQQTRPTFDVQKDSTFGQKPTLTFGVQTSSALGQQTTPIFGEQTISTLGQQAKPTFGVQTSSTLRQKLTQAVDMQTDSTLGQKTTPTVGMKTSLTLGLQTTPTFDVQKDTTFGQQTTPTFGEQASSTLGLQTTPTFDAQKDSTFGQKPTSFGAQTSLALEQQTTPTFGVQTNSALVQPTTPTFGVQTSSTFGQTTSIQSDDTSSEEKSTPLFGADLNKQQNDNFVKPEHSQSQESKLSILQSTISDPQSSQESTQTTANSNEIYQYNKPSTAFPVHTQASTPANEQTKGIQYSQQLITQSDAQSFSTPSRIEYFSRPNLPSRGEIFLPFPEQQKVTNSPLATQQTNQLVASTSSIDKGVDTKETTQFPSTSQSESTQYQPSNDPALNLEIQQTQSQQSGEVYHYNKPIADSSKEINMFGQKITQAQFSEHPNQNNLDITKPIAEHLSQTNKKFDNILSPTQRPDDHTHTGSTPSLKPFESRPQFSFYSICCQGIKTQKNKDNTQSFSGKIPSNTLNVTTTFEGVLNESRLKDKFGNQDSESTVSSGLGIQGDSLNFGGKGEEFGGPRNPPTFDETGYHY